jgi:hypothetical protein
MAPFPLDGFYWARWKHTGRWEPVEIREGTVKVLGTDWDKSPEEFSAFEPLERVKRQP